MKKKLSVVLIVALALITFVACSSKDAEVAETTETAPVATEVETETEAVDVVTTASIVTEGEAFVKALSTEGTWIAASLNDIELKDELVVDGEFISKEKIARKIALYTQDENHAVTAKFTLTVPKITVKSENTRVQSGTVKGDIYVENNGFNLVDATVDGNIYFATKEALDTYTIDDRSVVTGKIILDGVDVVTTASLVVTGNDLVKGLAADGTWIVAVYHNMKLKQEIVVDGEFMPKEAIDRKLALYTQDENRAITARFTLESPKMTVKSENFRIQGGTFKGDVYVENNGFQLSKEASVDGNVFFATQENKDSFILEEGSSVTGTMDVQ